MPRPLAGVFMGVFMEINGVANMMLIVSGALEDKKIDQETAAKLKEQLDFLHKYMLQYHKVAVAREAQISQEGQSELAFPAWHEVRDGLKR